MGSLRDAIATALADDELFTQERLDREAETVEAAVRDWFTTHTDEPCSVMDEVWLDAVRNPQTDHLGLAANLPVMLHAALAVAFPEEA